MSQAENIVVAGAGIVGLATAAALVQRGLPVTVVDSEDPGSGCSFGNAGCFSLASIVPVGMPGMWKKVPGWLSDPSGPLSIPWRYAPQIAPWVVKLLRNSSAQRVQSIADDLHTLLGPALQYWQPLARWAEVPELIQQRGWAVVYESAAAFQADRFGWEIRKNHGVKIECLEGASIQDLEPGLSSQFTTMAFLPEQASCPNPYRLSQAIASKLQRMGVQFVRARVQDFSFHDGKVSSVQTSNGPIKASQLVIAMGAFSKHFARVLGDDVPLDTERGYHTMVHTSQTLLTRPIMSSEGKFFASPMEEGIRFAGSVELGGLSLPPNFQRANILLDKGRSMLPSLETSVTSRWMGHRPSLPDSKPVIGMSSKVGNAFYGFGHGHVGLTAAAATGEVLADMIQGRTPTIDPAPFSAQRF